MVIQIFIECHIVGGALNKLHPIEFLAKMVSVVDSGNRCIIMRTNSDIEGEKTVVNHLLKCNQKFTLTCSFGELLKRKDDSGIRNCISRSSLFLNVVNSVR